VTSSTPTGSFVRPPQYLSTPSTSAGFPSAHPPPLCSACRLHTTRPQLPQGARQAVQAVCPFLGTHPLVRGAVLQAARSGRRARARHMPVARPRDNAQCRAPRRNPRGKPSTETSTPHSRSGRAGRSRGSSAADHNAGHATIQAAAPPQRPLCVERCVTPMRRLELPLGTLHQNGRVDEL